MNTVVDAYYEEYKTLSSYFEDKGEVSFKIAVETHLKKAILLAAASYFETLITEILITFSTEASNSNEVLVSFLKNKAIKLQYHKLFDWDKDKSNGANTFFSTMGESFRDYMKANVKASKKLEKSLDAFISLGNERNRLVRLNFGTYTVLKTIDEIYNLYNDASYFVNTLPFFLKMEAVPVEE
jgi:hypothetical protein